MRQSGTVSAKQKRVWRRPALAGRRARMAKHCPRGGEQLAERTLSLFHLLGLEQSDGSVSIYEAFASEPDTSYLRSALEQEGWQVVVPNPDFPSSRVAPFVEDFDGSFVCSSSGPESPNIAAIVLPGLIFGEDGARLGRGGGWYDQAVDWVFQAQDSRPVLVGLCFDGELRGPGLVPVETHDVPMDYVVTPNRTVAVS